MKIISEGVLVLASSQGLIQEFSEKEFNYDFPDGLTKLLKEQKIIALLTSEGDDLLIDIQENEELNSDNFDKVVSQYLNFKEKDELLLLSHAEFTMICRKGGNYKSYGWPVKKLAGLSEGTYRFDIGIDDVSERFEEFNAYFKLTISLNKVEGNKTGNKVMEIVE
jgi:hypothetical protein